MAVFINASIPYRKQGKYLANQNRANSYYSFEVIYIRSVFGFCNSSAGCYVRARKLAGKKVTPKTIIVWFYYILLPYTYAFKNSPGRI